MTIFCDFCEEPADNRKRVFHRESTHKGDLHICDLCAETLVDEGKRLDAETAAAGKAPGKQ